LKAGGIVLLKDEKEKVDLAESWIDFFNLNEKVNLFTLPENHKLLKI